MEQSLPFDGWFRIATQGLSEKAKSYIWQESEKQYQSAVKTEMANGFPEGQARNIAALTLGNPLDAQKKLKQDYISKYELKTVNLFFNERLTFGYNLLWLLITSIVLYQYLNNHYSLFAILTVYQIPIMGLLVTLILCTMVAVQFSATFLTYPRLFKQKNSLLKMISKSLIIHDGFAVFLMFLILMDTSIQFDTWDMLAGISIVNWILFSGFFLFLISHKIKIIQKLKKHNCYLTAE